MHGAPNWTCIACVLAERSRSAPQALETPCLRWPLPPTERPSLSHRASAPQPPRPRLLPAPRGSVFISFRRLSPAWMEALTRSDRAVSSGGVGGKPVIHFHHSVTKGTKDNTSIQRATVNWTASQMMHFAMHTVHILEPSVLVEQRQHRAWLCFCLHMQYVELLLRDSFDKEKVALLDRLIYAQQTLFLSIPRYSELWEPKNHYAQHFPVDILRFGPPVLYWEIKQAARLHLKSELVDAVGERCLPGTSSIIDELHDAGAIPGGQSVWVRWAYDVKLTHRRTLTRES
eukprot:3296982-Pleurochrysis_carterae.AAC.3